MTKDILDSQGNIIGELTLPDDTTDQQWSDALAHYTYTPPVPTVDQLVQGSVSAASKWGQSMLIAQAAQNVLLGITAAGKAQEFTDYCHELIHALMTGSLYEAIVLLDGYIADTSSTKTDLSPFVTNDRCTQIKNEIQTYLGVPLT